MKIRLHKLIQEPFVVFSAGSVLRHALADLVWLIQSGKVITDDFICLTRSGNSITLFTKLYTSCMCNNN